MTPKELSKETVNNLSDWVEAGYDLTAENGRLLIYTLRQLESRHKELAKCWKAVGKMIPDPLRHVIEAGDEITNEALKEKASKP